MLHMIGCKRCQDKGQLVRMVLPQMETWFLHLLEHQLGITRRKPPEFVVDTMLVR